MTEKYIAQQIQTMMSVFIEQRKAFLRAKRKAVSSQLVNSFELDVELTEGAVTATISYEDYGGFMEIKNLKWRGISEDFIKELEGWLKDTGFVQKLINKYQKRTGFRQEVNDKTINRIAWGIALKRVRTGQRTFIWWNKPLTGALNDLFNQILAGLPDVVEEEIVSSIGK